MEEVGNSINVASYVGSGELSANVMGYDNRPPTSDELARMQELVRKSMHEGALGVSAGMSYVPNIYMSSDELASIVRVAANMGGIFANHARTMNGTDPNAISEAIAMCVSSISTGNNYPKTPNCVREAGAGIHKIAGVRRRQPKHSIGPSNAGAIDGAGWALSEAGCRA